MKKKISCLDQNCVLYQAVKVFISAVNFGELYNERLTSVVSLKWPFEELQFWFFHIVACCEEDYFMLPCVCLLVCYERLLICFLPAESPAGNALADQTLSLHILTHYVMNQHDAPAPPHCCLYTVLDGLL